MRTTCTNLSVTVAAFAVVLMPLSAAAQAPANPPSAQAPAPAANCAPSRAVPEQGTIISPDATTGQAREPLGDKLARNDGVLCPPAGVDPDMRAPAPDVGKTPVIPPPGSPGGDPTVRPK